MTDSGLELRPQSAPARQDGIVLLLLVLMIFLAGSSLLLGVLNSNMQLLRQDGEVLVSLQKAREALISYAILHGDYYGATGAGPGHLPCPDSNGNGSENAPCAGNALGRLPESIVLPGGDVLPLNADWAGVDQQIWYGVSSAFRRSPVGVVNAATIGALSLDGRTDIVAVLIAPGQALTGQIRSSNNSGDYLEAGNDGGPTFVRADNTAPDNFNDTVLPIAAADIMAAVTARVAEAVKVQLDAYHGVTGTYPTDGATFSTAMVTAPAWFSTNAWDGNLDYSFVDANTASLSFTGCAAVYSLSLGSPAIGRTATQC